MSSALDMADDLVDGAADDQIASCLGQTTLRSFFLFAGAGSGKTGSLVKALKFLLATQSDRLWLHGQRVAVITYTNKARYEIAERLGNNSIFYVSTVHSFAWSLIEGFNNDIREWLRENLTIEIDKLTAQQLKGKESQASIDRGLSIISKNKRLTQLDAISEFIYSPDGDNRTRDSLNHSEVIKIATNFLSRSIVRDIFVNRFPILLIDESQDTNKSLIESLISVQQERKNVFLLGLFGDMMQRIYNDGKADLDSGLPDDWVTPIKKMNHRCSLRVVTLLNKIRMPVDGREQTARKDKAEGVVRLFLVPSPAQDKSSIEKHILGRMAIAAKDNSWNNTGSVKTLILEHHMAARRLGFLSLFEALSASDKLKSGLTRGDLSGLTFFSNTVLPITEAIENQDQYRLMALLRANSPILDSKLLGQKDVDTLSQISKARAAVDVLAELLDSCNSVTFSQILQCVRSSSLLVIPNSLQGFETVEGLGVNVSNGSELEDPVISAWRTALKTPYKQIKAYKIYMDGNAEFDTHHGVKGLQFKRVFVVMDDKEANGSMFSYEKLFGAKAGAKATDTTRRLFYVTCSRAEESLALVAYTEDPDAVRNFVVAEKWFLDQEVIIIQ
ncbi:AAA family ATPase [Massilia sp. DJPM01]|uniref:UvrD-helicase domain-containing protein n=1 Tax=Massilia sp. DJPM01 TaxID=3024404 RepID=UPI00259F3D55|nr:UvrD-helicase domain-containing protein [Massilia sp. DJPM01]MDM5180805.1 AAA family ATPase [Massilia sp. DJPM01]